MGGPTIMKSTPGVGHGGLSRLEYPSRVSSLGKILMVVGEVRDAVGAANIAPARRRSL